MKFFIFLFLSMMSVFIRPSMAQEDQAGSAYSYTFTTLIEKQELPLSAFKGKVVMVVNTASKCGFTKQFDALQAIYDKYKDKGFVVIGVPSNDFANQEPGTDVEIADFCKLTYDVNFPMTSKTKVTGDDAHPFYKWAATTLGWQATPKWNFHKYIIDKNGKLVDYFNSTTAPDAERVTTLIERLLAE